MFQPIILGKRLPQGIIDKIALDLSNPNTFFTSRGFVSESLESEFYDVNGPFMLGMILAPVQLMIILGLYNAGKTEFAQEAIRRWCDTALELGAPLAVTRDVDHKKSCVRPPEPCANPVFPQGVVPAALSSWGAACFLALGELLNREEEGA
jgi:hypothetical protein